MLKHKLDLKVLPGESFDGRGRLRIHYFVNDEGGPIHLIKDRRITRYGFIDLGGGTGYIACQPERTSIVPELLPDGYMRLFLHSNSISAVTCPECLATKTAREHLLSLEFKREKKSTLPEK